MVRLTLFMLTETRKEGVRVDIHASLSTSSRRFDTSSENDETGKQTNLSIKKTPETPLLKQLQARIKFSGIACFGRSLCNY